MSSYCTVRSVGWDVMGPQIQNFTLICFFFTWRRALHGVYGTILPVTLNSSQLKKTFLKIAPKTKFLP